jgi:hypothetical protein
MKPKLLVVLGILAVAAFAASGCSRNDSSLTGTRSMFANPLAPGGAPTKPDSIPGGPPPPKPPPILPVTFVFTDSAVAGETVNTFWQLGNPNHTTFTTHWRLTEDQGWAGFPIEGDATLPPLSTQTLQLQFTVPDSAGPGFYPLHMTVTQKHGGDFTADGAVQVFPTGGDSLVTQIVR